MSIKVVKWPPVGVVGAEWSEVAPVQRSASLITGADYRSAVQRKRRVASLEVSSLSADQMGAGYMEMLKRWLAGINAVRLTSYPINRHYHAAGDPAARQSQPLTWTSGGDELSWRDGGEDLIWVSGTLITGVAGEAGGFPAITVSGCAPNALVARPGEFLTAWRDASDEEGATAQITAPARSDASGAAVIRLFDALPAGDYARVNLGSADTGVFYPESLPRSVQPVRGDWTWSWRFREIFEDEVGGFEEVDPWS